MKRPLVSILTPTYNRGAFFRQYLKYVRHQDYKGPLEILIADDGTESIEALVPAEARFRYLRLDAKMPLGAKRNLLMAEARGDYLVNMDDDDYYPPTRVSHAVERLQASGLGLAGSSKMYIYNTATQIISVSGPFGPTHATANTMAFTREFAATRQHDPAAQAQEEPSITAGFSLPMVQLDAEKTVLQMQHQANTWDKKGTTQRATTRTLKSFVKDTADRRFYRELAQRSAS